MVRDSASQFAAGSVTEYSKGDVRLLPPRQMEDRILCNYEERKMVRPHAR